MLIPANDLTAFTLFRWQAWEALIRIVTSPTPYVYRHMLATLVFLFVFLFPLGYVTVLRSIVIPATMAVCTGVYGLLELAQELENPLGWDDNDIDLNGLQVLTIQVAALLGRQISATCTSGCRVFGLLSGCCLRLHVDHCGTSICHWRQWHNLNGASTGHPCV